MRQRNQRRVFLIYLASFRNDGRYDARQKEDLRSLALMQVMSL